MRTFEEILQSIVDKKNQQIPELTSSSMVAIWYVWANVVALAIYTFEAILYKEKEELEEYARLQRYGTLPWWVPQILYFQLGDPLTYNSITGTHYYAVIDATKNIIKRVAIIEIGGVGLIIKVAKLDNNEFVKLTASELSNVNNYVNEIKPAGTLTTVVSVDADILDSEAEIYYDGNYLEADIKTLVNEALNTYKTNINYQNINGKILKNEIIDILRNIPAVNDVLFTALQAKPYGGNYAGIEREYNTSAGYFNYIPDMIDSWTYIPINDTSTL